MSDLDEREVEGLVGRLREGYNPPPPTPRDAMWTAIEAGLSAPAAADVIPLHRPREAVSTHRPLGWAVAAAAVLILGVGIGRMTAPAAGPVAALDAPVAADGAVLRAAAVDHFGRTEALLTLVRAEGREGSLDPQIAEWARTLLTQTRLFLDSPVETDPGLVELMEDLEMVLAQIAGASGSGGNAAEVDSRHTELRLVLDGLEERKVLTRIQAVSGPVLAGT